MNDDFEKQLRAASFKPVPKAWREEILQAAHAARRSAMPLSGVQSPKAEIAWWSRWLWPNPLAWGSLALIWGIIIGARLTSATPEQERDAGRPMAKIQRGSTIQEQRALLSQLLDSSAAAAAPADSTRPRRRSERHLEQEAA